MGLQMLNDPTLALKKGERPLFQVNAEIGHDMFVCALKDIAAGEEIFIEYGWDQAFKKLMLKHKSKKIKVLIFPSFINKFKNIYSTPKEMCYN